MNQGSEIAGDDDASSRSSSSWCLVDGRDSASDSYVEADESSASIISDQASLNASSLSSYLSQLLMVAQAEGGEVDPELMDNHSEPMCRNTSEHSSIAASRTSSICLDCPGSLEQLDNEADDASMVDAEELKAETTEPEPFSIASKLDELVIATQQWPDFATQFKCSLPEYKMRNWLPYMGLGIAALLVLLTWAFYASSSEPTHLPVSDEWSGAAKLDSLRAAPSIFAATSRDAYSKGSKEAPTRPGKLDQTAHHTEGSLAASSSVQAPASKQSTGETCFSTPSSRSTSRNAETQRKILHNLELCQEELDDAKSSFKGKAKLLHYFRRKEAEQEGRIRDLERRLVTSETQLRELLAEYPSGKPEKQDMPTNVQKKNAEVDVDIPTPMIDGHEDESIWDAKKNNLHATKEDRPRQCHKIDGMLSNLTRSFLSALRQFPYLNTSTKFTKLFSVDYLDHLRGVKQLSSWFQTKSADLIRKPGPMVRNAQAHVKQHALQLWNDLPTKLGLLKAAVPKVVDVMKDSWLNRVQPLVQKVGTAVAVFRDIALTSTSPAPPPTPGTPPPRFAPTHVAGGGNDGLDNEDGRVFNEDEAVEADSQRERHEYQAADRGVGSNDLAKREDWAYSRAQGRQQMRQNASTLLELERGMNWQWLRAHNRHKYRKEASMPVVQGNESRRRFSGGQRRHEVDSEGCSKEEKLMNRRPSWQPSWQDKIKKKSKAAIDWLLVRGAHRSRMRIRKHWVDSELGGFY